MSFPRVFCSCCVIVLAMPALETRALAQTSSSSSSSSLSKPVGKTAPVAHSPLDSGKVSNGVYRNPAFGFACKIPPGWVLRTEEMNTRDDGETMKDAGKTARVLLATFSRPPQASGEDVNGSIVIAAESATAIPGLTEAAQYFGLVDKAAEAQGFELDDDPYEFAVGTKTVVRGDFQKDVGTRVMRQSTLVVLARGYAVSFTFIGGTEDEVEESVAGLSFAAAATAHPH
jgi:hypothetical protein